MAVVVILTAAVFAVGIGLLVGIGIGRELARRKAAEADARVVAKRAGDLTDALLAAVSHELRTPLNAIVGWVHLLKAGSLSGAESARALDAIERNAQTETLLVSNLLDEARLRERLAPMRMMPSNLEEIVRNAVAALMASARAQALDIRVDVEDPPPIIDADRERIGQAVWNLVANAIKFTPRGGRIAVEAGRTDGEAEVRVTDSGEGIDPAFLPHVFEPFRQGTTHARRAGVGLGLSIVKQIVELHGGTVSAASPGRGHGATFSFIVPARSSASTGDLAGHEPDRDQRQRHAEQPRNEVSH
jgi:signal transduction histidine kinase